MDLVYYANALSCCFFGHRDVVWTEELERVIYFLVKRLILEENVVKFYFGDHSHFVTLCYKVVAELQIEFPHIKLIAIPVDSMAILLRDNEEDIKFSQACHWMIYDYAVRPPNISKAGKASYVERNQFMIDKSDFCIVYYDPKYSPKEVYRKGRYYQPRSGTKVALDYAISKKKTIYSVLNYLEGDTLNKDN